ncbi:MAG TPA: hypothetical protein VJ964_08085 [Balneolaceae bacterium]|nr:hypothetical protein [Balneolaceae bacterium]
MGRKFRYCSTVLMRWWDTLRRSVTFRSLVSSVVRSVNTSKVDLWALPIIRSTSMLPSRERSSTTMLEMFVEVLVGGIFVTFGGPDLLVEDHGRPHQSPTPPSGR